MPIAWTLVPGAILPTKWRSTMRVRLLGNSPVGTASGFSYTVRTLLSGEAANLQAAQGNKSLHWSSCLSICMNDPQPASRCCLQQHHLEFTFESALTVGLACTETTCQSAKAVPSCDECKVCCRRSCVLPSTRHDYSFKHEAAVPTDSTLGGAGNV